MYLNTTNAGSDRGGYTVGNSFGTTGEILFHDWGIDGAGAKAADRASIEYACPLEFPELAWSGCTAIGHKINLTDTVPQRTKGFKIPHDVTAKKWVRFAVWDSAGNVAWVPPVAVQSQ